MSNLKWGMGKTGKIWNREKRQRYKSYYKSYGKVTDVGGGGRARSSIRMCLLHKKVCPIYRPACELNCLWSFCVMWGNQNVDFVYSTRKCSACQWCIYLCLSSQPSRSFLQNKTSVGLTDPIFFFQEHQLQTLTKKKQSAQVCARTLSVNNSYTLTVGSVKLTEKKQNQITKSSNPIGLKQKFANLHTTLWHI
jgi:hypothetical protein